MKNPRFEARPAAKAGSLLLSLMLVAQGFVFGAAASPKTPPPAPAAAPAQAAAEGFSGTQGTAASAIVHFGEIARQDALAPEAANVEPRAIHPPLSVNFEGGLPAGAAQPSSGGGEAAVPDAATENTQPLIPSPTPSTNFLGLVDNQQVVPPDTMGAVGHDHVVTILNDRMRIQDRAGNVISTASTDSFWAPLAAQMGIAFNTFDPRVYYDRHTGRYIYVITANARQANSAILLAVSRYGDPTREWNLYGVDADSTNVDWADFPSVGFNQNWIVVTVNIFSNASNPTVYRRPDIYVFNKGQALQNNPPSPTVNFTKFTGNNTGSPTAITGFTLVPSIDEDNTSPNKMWLVENWNPTSGLLRVSTITGAVGSESINPGRQFPQSPESWFGGEVLLNSGWAPQANDAKTAPHSVYIQNNDARLQNVSYRNGRLWTTHTVFEPTVHQPAGTNPNSLANPVDHSAIQWWVLDPALEPGAFTTAPLQRGLIEDLTADNCHNGSGGLRSPCTPTGNFYAFPTIAVNNTDDAVIGYTRFNALDWAAAAYSYREHTDPVNTFRDPVVYKVTTTAEGSGRYSKGATVRWGDYSSSMVDPRNDHHFWTVQEYAAPRINAGATSAWSTWWAHVPALTPPPTLAGNLVISEFRLHGTNGALDEFIEIYNRSGDPITVQSADIAGTGFAVVSSDGVTKCVIPNGTVIPDKGHYLCANSAVGGYSLSTYPGAGATTTPDATYTSDTPINAGIALFRTTLSVNFTAANRLDAVGSTSEPNPLFKEGTGYLPISPFNVNGSHFRRIDTADSEPLETNDNGTDFRWADTQGTPMNGGAVQLLGAPGPENLASPRERGESMPQTLVAPCTSSNNAPNRVRVTGNDGTNTNGTLSIRRTVTNNTGTTVTRLRFRVAKITTFPKADASTADLRVRTSSNSTEPQPCGGGSVNILGLTLEQAAAPNDQPNGGGYNSSLAVPTVSIPGGLAPGASINVNFLLGVMSGGNYSFFVSTELLP